METTKDSIDWSHVHESFKWMARDKDGHSFLYQEKPRLIKDYWNIYNGGVCFTSGFSSYKIGTINWKDSLVERPKASEE